MKRQAQNWKKIFATHINDKGCIPRTYKEHKSSKKSNRKMSKKYKKAFHKRAKLKYLIPILKDTQYQY